jgi:hypothetical protein
MDQNIFFVVTIHVRHISAMAQKLVKKITLKSYVSSEFQEFIINDNEGKSSDIFDEVSDME